VDAAGDHFYFNSGINNIIQNIVLASGGATQITFAGTSANNTVIGTDLETSMIAVGDTNTNTYSLWLPSTQNTMLLWQGSTGASSFQMAGGTTSGLALGTRMTATTIASVDRAGMYTTAGGGSAPFDVWGNLILKPDDQANLGVELWTGATPAVRLQVNETAVTAYKPLKDGASNTVTYYVAKTRKVTVGHKGETTTDFAWATAAGHAAANLDLGAVIPAHARVLDVTIICTEALVGQSDITIGAGNAAAGTQFFTAASCDELNETVASAAGAAAFVTASNAAQNLWLVGDPSDNNWSDQTAGMWKVFITYIDVASAE
jgi:hypothetical protein